MKTSTTLEECPIGLFESEGGELCLKTEYGNNEGRIDAYIVSSGEFFWGSHPQTIANQRKQIVRPMDVQRIPLVQCETCEGDGADDDGDHCPACGGLGWVRHSP
jgi:DnaJ-class molecular chaperone